MLQDARLSSILSSTVLALVVAACSSGGTPSPPGSDKSALAQSVTTQTGVACADEGFPGTAHPQNCCNAAGTACILGLMADIACPAPYTAVTYDETQCCAPLRDDGGCWGVLSLEVPGGFDSGAYPAVTDPNLIPAGCGLGPLAGGCPGAEQYCVFPASGGLYGQCLPLPTDCNAFPQGVCGSTREGPNPTQQFFASACDARAAGYFVLYAGPCQ